MIKPKRKRGEEEAMSRRTKLEFEPLSLEETAKQLGVPRQRAQRILTLIGADVAPSPHGLRAKRRTVRYKVARKSARIR
jgi:hypothetical protein